MNISNFSQQIQSIDFKSIDYSLANRLFVKYMPGITSAILVLILAQSMATLTWDVLPETPFVEPPDISANQRVVNNRNPSGSANTAGYNQIRSFHLFGIARNKQLNPVVVAPTAQDAPDTQLRLTLKGVVASDDIMEAWAIIADRMGNEESYTIEDSLPGGAILKEIYSDRIILLHSGRMETLRLPQTELTGKNKIRNSASRRANSRLNSRRMNRSSSSNNVNRLSSAATQTLKSYRDKLLNDPQSVMNSVRAEPYRQAGKLKGYRIFPGRDKQLFGQMGLEPGDIVTSVNGIALDSPLKGLEIMQQLSSASSVSVDVLRNGVSQSFESSL